MASSEVVPVPAAELMKRLAAERARRRLTQADVAREMHTTQSYVARLEGGDHEPKLSTFLRYAMIVAGAALLAKILQDLARGGAGARLG